jgi:UDP-2-acetamido-3-amino-2,3-dideoxy-glucuronate N-acetyltransferase
MSEADVKVAVVGCGYWGKNLVRNFAELGALGAVVDGRPEVAADMSAKYGAPARSYEEVLADPGIAGVVIAAPAELHAQLALKAFEAGKHVYVEKPIALSVADGETMKAAAVKAGRQLMVGHLLRYHPAFEALLEFVQGGGIGDVRYAYSNRLSLGKFRVEENVLWSFAPHDVSMLLALMGERPSAVRISGGAYVTPGIEDESRIDMDFASGRRAHVFTSWAHPFKEQRLVVVGSTGAAAFEDSLSGPDKLRVWRHSIDTSGREPIPVKAEPEHLPFGNGEPLRQECAHFISCCATNTTPRTDADEALAVLSVMTGAV